MRKNRESKECRHASSRERVSKENKYSQKDRFLPILAVGAIISGVTGNCMNLGLVSFGCTPETLTKSTNTLRETIKNRLLINAKADITTMVTNSNNLVINISAHSVKGVKIKQTLKGNIKIVSNISKDVQADINTALHSETKDAFENLSLEEQSFLTKSSGGKTVTQIHKEIDTIIDNTTSIDALDSINNVVKLGQTLYFNLTAYEVENIEVSQDFGVDVFVDAAIDQTMTAIAKSATIRKIEEYIINENISKGDTTLKYTMIILAVGVVIIAFAYVTYTSRKKK